MAIERRRTSPPSTTHPPTHPPTHHHLRQSFLEKNDLLDKPIYVAGVSAGASFAVKLPKTLYSGGWVWRGQGVCPPPQRPGAACLPLPCSVQHGMALPVLLLRLLVTRLLPAAFLQLVTPTRSLASFQVRDFKGSRVVGGQSYTAPCT